MNPFIEIVSKSVLQDPIKHATGMAVTSVGVVTDQDASVWFSASNIAVLVGISVGVITIVKAYYEIRLIKSKLNQKQDV